MNFLKKIRPIFLDNGMAVYLLPRPGQPAVEIQCHVRTGSIHEAEFLGCGLSHFLEHMLFQGSRNFPGTAASDKIGALGGDINAYTSFDHTAYHCEIPARHWAEGLGVIADMVRYPEFPEARFTSERDVILRECELGNDNPDRRLTERLWKQVFRVHPVRIPIIGYKEKIADVTRERMSEYYRRRYTPGRTFWVIVGNVEPERVFDELNRLCGDWAHGDLHDPVLPKEPHQRVAREENAFFADPMMRLGLGFRLPDGAHEDIPALDLLCGLTGMSDASRLVRHLRQESELAVAIESFCYVQRFGGVFAVVANAEPGRGAKLEKALLKELDSIRRDGFSAAELEREKNQQTAEQLRQMRTNGGIASLIGAGIYAADAPDWAERYLDRLQQVDVERLREVANRYLSPESGALIRQYPEAARTANKRTAAAAETGMEPEALTGDHDLRGVFLPGRELPLVDFSLILPGGAIWEAPEQGGISRLLTSLLGGGCDRCSESEAADRFERYGANVNISSGLNSLAVRLNAPRRTFGKALTLLLDTLRAPDFGKKVVEREKYNLLQLLDSRRNEPRAVAMRATAEMIFAAHPYANGTWGGMESVGALGPGDLKAFWERICTRSQAVAGFGGDLSRDEASYYLKQVAEGLNWGDTAAALPALPCYPAAEGRREIRLEREQTVVSCSVPGCDCLRDEKYALDLLSDAMNGLSSRLFKIVREEHALAYSTGMRQTSGWQGGMLNFFAVTAAENAEKALALLQGEMDRLAQNGLSETEFAEARDGAVFTRERMAAEVGDHLFSSTLAVFYGEPATGLLRDIEALKQLTRESANGVYARYLGNMARQTVIAGNIQ